ncbi:AEC family transporter [Ideonella azotifigens]|uniref:AEC family transporter n=1 Tax=Ideonella azotifigens TaxID=513160 RepID=A0ABN1KGJ6_9BURK|nr:AEC family transporter [Ideonella azotifigens]MCD2340474.1 AEC family transporter [Ideonella azotifigens]
MLNILLLTAPIYLLMALGYAIARGGLFDAPDFRTIGRFVVNVALPCMLFHALARQPIAKIFDVHYLGAYAAGSLLMLLGTTAWARLRQGRTMPHSALLGMGVSSSNSAYVGYPIAVQWLGPVAGVALALTMLVENLIIIPLALVLAAQGDAEVPWRATLQRVFGQLVRTPLIVAMALGVLFSLTGLTLPDLLMRPLQMMAVVASPVSLFVIGGSLHGAKLEGQRSAMGAVMLGKLVMHPMAVALAFWLLPAVSPELRNAGLMLAAAPMLSIYPMMALRYHWEGFCAAVLLITTLASFITASGWLWVLKTWG